MQDSSLLGALAQALLAGEPTVDLLVYRCSRMLGKSWRWIRPLALRYLDKFGTGLRPRHRDVVRFLRGDAGFQRARSKYSDKLLASEVWTAPLQMQPASAARTWDLPTIDSPGDLAKWLGLDPGELRWFADLKALGYKKTGEQLRHYHYRILAKRFGSVRLIEAPKPRLKDLQRQTLLWILQKIPPHPSVHGFVKGRSIKTFVAPHVGRRVVLRMDLRDFFPTFGGVRIQNLFRTLDIPKRSPIFSAESAPTPLRAISGMRSPKASAPCVWKKSGACMRGRICRRARRHRRRWRTFPSTG